MPKKNRRKANSNNGLWSSLTAMPNIQPIRLMSIWPHLLLITVALTAWYGWCAPRSVALEDDGEFITVAWLFGVSHPPGYPLFTWLAYPFKWLPFGDPAWRIHLVSGFYGALACAMLFWISRLLIPGNIVAYAAAFGAGLSRVFWSQAIIAEIYTINVFLFALAFALTLLYVREGQIKWFAAALFVYALGISNHWPLIVLATPALGILLLPRLHASIVALPRVLPFFVLGLLPYLWMWWRTNAAPEVSFYGELGSWPELQHYINRSGYTGVDNSAAAGISDKLQYYGFQAKELLWQYTPLGFAFIVVGVLSQFRRLGLSVSLALTAAVLSATFLLLTVLNFDYEYRKQVVFQVYPLLPYATLGIWLALGIDEVRLRFLAPRGSSIALLGSIGIAITIVAANLLWHSGQNDRHDYDHARDYATTLLETMDKNAVAIVHSDVNTTTLSYFHFVEGMRPDITLVNDQGIGQAPDGRIFHPVRAPALNRDEIVAAYAEAHAEAGRPVYFFGPEPFRLSVEEYGVYKKLSPRMGTQGQPISTFMVNETLLNLYRRIAEKQDIEDAWTRRHRDTIIQQYARWLTYMVNFHSSRNLRNKYRPELDAFTAQHYLAEVTRLQILVDRDRLQDAESLRANINHARTLIDQYTSKSHRADIDRVAGELERKLGNNDAAMAAYKRSLDTYADPSNGAANGLAQVYAAAGDCDGYFLIKEQYLDKRLQFPEKLNGIDRSMRRRCAR